jgi:hypothetical protein
MAAGGEPIRIWGSSASGTAVGESGDVVGWLDNDRILIQRKGSSLVSVLDLKSGATVDSCCAGGFWGTFPAALS